MFKQLATTTTGMSCTAVTFVR